MGEQVLKDLYKGYGDIPPFGTGPDQQLIHREGNAYIHRLYPKTDFIQSCRIVDQTIQHVIDGDPYKISEIFPGEEGHKVIIGDFIEKSLEEDQLAAAKALRGANEEEV